MESSPLPAVPDPLPPTAPAYDQRHLDEIDRLAEWAANLNPPEEACGLLVGLQGMPESVTCIPLANEAPADQRDHSYALSVGVVQQAIRDWLDALPHNYLPPGITRVQVLVWHSHPGPTSTKGPSGKDLELRAVHAHLPHMVCALPDDPDDPAIFVRY